ncbi:MAG: DNA-binding protein [Lachnospiraceae bacterium]|nr:DNA-binding protein [Lachnospiraceae bacterium]
MESFVRESLLYDFYGELLTDHQKKIFQEVVFNDFSVSEVARDEGISRQGVHDMVRRSEKALEEYESRLHLVDRFLKIRNQIDEIRRLTVCSGGDAEENLKKIRTIAEEIRGEL